MKLTGELQSLEDMFSIHSDEMAIEYTKRNIAANLPRNAAYSRVSLFARHSENEWVNIGAWQSKLIVEINDWK